MVVEHIVHSNFGEPSQFGTCKQQEQRRGIDMQDSMQREAMRLGVSPPAASSAFGKDSWNKHAMRSKNGTRAMRRGSKFDNVMPTSKGAPLTTWDHVIRSVESSGANNRYMNPREVFNTLDKNGDGFIDAKELHGHLGGSSKEAVESIMNQADKQGNGKISYAEFTNVLGLRRKSVSPVPTPPNLTPNASPASSPIIGSSLTKYYMASNKQTAPPQTQASKFTAAATYNKLSSPRWNSDSFIDFN